MNMNDVGISAICENEQYNKLLALEYRIYATGLGTNQFAYDILIEQRLQLLNGQMENDWQIYLLVNYLKEQKGRVYIDDLVYRQPRPDDVDPAFLLTRASKIWNGGIMQFGDFCEGYQNTHFK